jgi:hypothetical protein
MKQFATYALLAGISMLTACGGGGAGAAGGIAPGSSQSTNAASSTPLTVIDATGLAVTSLTFPSAGAQYARTLTVTAPSFSGSYTKSDTCAQIASVAAVSNAGGKGVFKVTPLGGGTCSITISGDGGTITIPVGVTATPITVN